MAKGGSKFEYLVSTSSRWAQQLYVFYESHGITPIVVNADDEMTSEDVTRHLCSRIGLDPSQAVFKWDKTSDQVQDKMHPKLSAIQDTLLSSGGARADRSTKHLDLDEEKKKRREEFSLEGLSFAEESLDREIPHYEFLRERRLKM